MDLNLAVISGRLAAEPEIRTFESGVVLASFLVTARSAAPRRRLDVIPIALWNIDPASIPDGSLRGADIWVAGAVQRRFWSADRGRMSRIEIVAHTVEIRSNDDTVILSSDGERSMAS